MKIASVLMTLVFAGVVAQANEPAHTTTTAPAAPATAEVKAEVKAEKKAAKKKHAKKEDKKEEAAAPAGH